MKNPEMNALAAQCKAPRLEIYRDGTLVDTRVDVEVIPLAEHRRLVAQAATDVLSCVRSLSTALAQAGQQVEAVSTF